MYQLIAVVCCLYLHGASVCLPGMLLLAYERANIAGSGIKFSRVRWGIDLDFFFFTPALSYHHMMLITSWLPPFPPSALPNLLSVLPSDLDLSLSRSLFLSHLYTATAHLAAKKKMSSLICQQQGPRELEKKKTEPNYNTKSSALHILTILYPMPQDFRHTRCRSLHFSSSSFLLQSIKISTLFLAHAGFQAVWKTGMVHHGKKKDYQQKQNIARATLETDQKRGIMRVINEWRQDNDSTAPDMTDQTRDWITCQVTKEEYELLTQKRINIDQSRTKYTVQLHVKHVHLDCWHNHNVITFD